MASEVKNMKKKILLALLVILALASVLFISACNGGGGDDTTYYTVTFDTSRSSEKTEIPAQSVASGGKVTDPGVTLTRTGYEFEGWYIYEGITAVKKWDFANDTVTSDITLTAKFKYVIDTDSTSCPRGGEHDYQVTSYKAPTCKADGRREEQCSKCRARVNYTKREDPTLARLEHIEQVESREPTCAVAGYTRVFCENGCGLDETNEIPATNAHIYETDESGNFVWTTTKLATKYVNGVRERACVNCEGAKVSQAVDYTATQTDLKKLSIVNFKYTGGTYNNAPFVNVANYGRITVSSYYTSAMGHYINDTSLSTYWSADTYANGSNFTEDYFGIEWDKAYTVGALRLILPYYSDWGLGDECYVSYKLSYWDETAGEYVEWGEISDKNATASGTVGELMITFSEPIVTSKFKAEVTHATRYAPAMIYELEAYADTAERERIPVSAVGGAFVSISGKYNEWVSGADALIDNLAASYWNTDARYNETPWAMYEYSKETTVVSVQFSTPAHAKRSFMLEIWVPDSSQPEGGRWQQIGSLYTVPANKEEAAQDPSIVKYGYDDTAKRDICIFNADIEYKTTKIKLSIISEPVYWESYVYDFIPYTISESAKGEDKTILCEHRYPKAEQIPYVDEYGNDKTKDKIIDPTCTTAGYKVMKCECGHVMFTDATDKLGHSYGEAVISQEASAVALGVKTQTCTVDGCGATHSVAYALDYEAPVITDYYHNATAGWAQSFDDGNYPWTYEWAVPMLEKYNYKATMVMSITYGEGLVKEWTEWFATGTFDLGSHSYNHTSIYNAPPSHASLLKEVIDAQYWFRSTFKGQKCLVFAAPLGATSDGVANYLAGPMVANRNGGQTGTFYNTLDQLDTRKTAGNVNTWVSKSDQTEGDYVFIDPKNPNANFKAVEYQAPVLDDKGNVKKDSEGNVITETKTAYVPYDGTYVKGSNGVYSMSASGEYVLLPNQHGEFKYVLKQNLVFSDEHQAFADIGLDGASYFYDAETYRFVLVDNAGYNVTETDTDIIVKLTIDGEEVDYVVKDYSYSYAQGGKYKLIKTSIGSYEGFIDELIEKNGWTVECLHSLGHGSIYSSFDSTVSKFEYLKRRGVWAGSYNELVQYRKQYSNTTLSIVEKTDSRLEISMTDDLDNTMFDHALTIKIALPEGWTNVVVKQGESVIEQVTMAEYMDDMTKVVCTVDGGYIYVDALPDSANIVIEKQ